MSRDNKHRPAFGIFPVLSILLGVGLLAAPMAGARAEAGNAPRLYRFQIVKKPLTDALLDLALQAQVSLGGDLSACRRTNVALAGRFSLSDGLTQVLVGSDCTAQIANANSVIIHHHPPSSAKPSPPAPTPPVSPTEVGEVVVTAGRQPELPGRTPYSVTAVSGTQLDATGTTDLTRVSEQIAGMTVTNLGPGRDKVLLRGMSDGAFTGLTQSTVGLYVDNVPVTYNAPDPDLRLIDVDRLEIMRGPQGTLYGAGSLGGIVRIVTRRPDLDERSGTIEVARSQTQSGGPNTDLAITGNTPILAGRVGLRGSIYSETSSGYLDDLNQGQRNTNRSQRQGGRIALRAAVTPNWSLTAGLIHQAISTRDSQYALAGLGALNRANLVAEPHVNTFDERYLTLEGEGEWGRLVGSSASLSHHFRTRHDASGVLSAFGGAGAGALDDSQDIDLWVNELVFTSPQGRSLSGLVGVFYSSGASAGDTRLVQRGTVPTELYSESRTDGLREAALYGEGSWNLSDRFTLLAGLRWFRFDYNVQSLVTQGTRHRTFSMPGQVSGLSPKISLRFQPDDNFMVYGQASQGYRAGGFNTAGTLDQRFDGNQFAPEHDFDPDHFWNYELGTKLSVLDNRVRLRMALYYAAWRNIQSDQFLPSGLTYAVNVGDGANRGLEAEASWRANEHWVLSFAGLVNDPQLVRVNSGFPSQRDAGLPGVASGSASLGVEYRRTLTRDLSLRAESRTTYVGPSHLTFDAQPRYEMGDYFTGHIQAALEAKSWTATAFIDNSLDSRANTFAFGSPFRRPGDIVTTPLRPRTLGVRLEARF